MPQCNICRSTVGIVGGRIIKRDSEPTEYYHEQCYLEFCIRYEKVLNLLRCSSIKSKVKEDKELELTHYHA